LRPTEGGINSPDVSQGITSDLVVDFDLSGERVLVLGRLTDDGCYSFQRFLAREAELAFAKQRLALALAPPDLIYPNFATRTCKPALLEIDLRVFFPRSGTGHVEGKTDQAKPDWPASAEWLSDRFLPKAALRPRMLSRALRPGLIFASLASADVPRRLASTDWFLNSCLLVSEANVSTTHFLGCSYRQIRP